MNDREEFRERVREASDIVEVVSETVGLRPHGQDRFKGLCPFHSEKTPSFHVDRAKQFFHCFGCQTGGDVFAFVMKRDGSDFPAALGELAARANLEPPSRDPEAARKFEALREANRQALDFFREQLAESGGDRARRSLEKRGVSGEVAEEMQLGFAPEGWTRLVSKLGAEEIPEEILEEAGLATRGQRGLRDFFRNRLMVPIRDPGARVIAFAGRSLDESGPKYVNTRDGPLFHKGSVLFGLDRARSAIRRERSALLLEGYFDCIQAWRVGVAGAVAVCGTALTEAHARLLKRDAREVVLSFDPDASGRRAARRSLPLLVAAGLEVRVAAFPDGGDPDDFIRANGGEAFRRVVGSARDWLSWLIDGLAALPEVERARARIETGRLVAEVLARLPDPLEREEAGRGAAGRLGYGWDTFQEALREETARAAARIDGGVGRGAGARRTGPGRTRGESGGVEAAGNGRRAGGRRTGSGRSPGRSTDDGAGPRERSMPTEPTLAEREFVRWGVRDPVSVARLLQDSDSAIFDGLVAAPLLRAMKKAADAWSGGGLPPDESPEGSPDGSTPDLLAAVRAEPGPPQAMLAGIEMDPVPLSEQQTPEDSLDALRRKYLERRLDEARADARRDGGEAALRRIRDIRREMEELQRDGRSRRSRRAPNRVC